MLDDLIQDYTKDMIKKNHDVSARIESGELCAHCYKPIPYSRRKIHSKYCSKACEVKVEGVKKKTKKTKKKPKYTKCRHGGWRFVCVICKKETIGRKRQKYCSDECRDKAIERVRWKGLSTSTIGAINELRVAGDLMTKGYEVFRALSPACSCDLVALKNGVLSRIEVRTAYRSRTGITRNATNFRGDILAFVLPKKIIYEPELIDQHDQDRNNVLSDLKMEEIKIDVDSIKN
jgi:Holliday junction resolvase